MIPTWGVGQNLENCPSEQRPFLDLVPHSFRKVFVRSGLWSERPRPAVLPNHAVDEHIATGAPECRYCPVCRVVHVVRDVSPEVRSHLMTAGASLVQAAAALMATAVQDDKDRGSGGVERIDLDDEWPEDPT